MGTQTTLTISISITERYYLGHQETLFLLLLLIYCRKKPSMKRYGLQLQRFAWKFLLCSFAMSCMLCVCEEKWKWWDMKTVVRLEYAKLLNVISVKLRMRFKTKRAHESIIRDCYTDSQCNPMFDKTCPIRKST